MEFRILSSIMNYLRYTRKKVQETITYTENVSIITENFIGANTVRKVIEEIINLILVFYLKVTTGVESRAGISILGSNPIFSLALEIASSKGKSSLDK